MPELPDVVVYLDALRDYLAERVLQKVLVRSPFVLRSFEPALEDFQGRTLSGFERMGKQIIWRFDGGSCLLFHLMIAGRFHWRKPGASPRGKNDLVAFQFEHGVMMFTEASKKQRASLRAFSAESGLEEFRQGGLDALSCSPAEFAEAMTKQNRTLKRALTDPRLLDGIGNAYSDEILHAARLSPVQRTKQLSPDQLKTLHAATVDTLEQWITRLSEERQDKFPEKVTAFRKQMAAHGKFGQPCPDCQTPIQRIVYAENETNYCPTCQTGGKLLADRSLSRLLKDDWPKRLDG